MAWALWPIFRSLNRHPTFRGSAAVPIPAEHPIWDADHCL